MILYGAAAEEPEEPGRYAFEQHCLADDENDGHERVKFHVMQVQILEPTAQKMEDEKEINRHENDVDRELDQERSQRL
jgi:hypothetical protein